VSGARTCLILKRDYKFLNPGIAGFSILGLQSLLCTLRTKVKNLIEDTSDDYEKK